MFIIVSDGDLGYMKAFPHAHNCISPSLVYGITSPTTNSARWFWSTANHDSFRFLNLWIINEKHLFLGTWAPHLVCFFHILCFPCTHADVVPVNARTNTTVVVLQALRVILTSWWMSKNILFKFPILHCTDILSKQYWMSHPAFSVQTNYSLLASVIC